MYIPVILCALLAPLAVVSAPADSITGRQAAPIKPEPCIRRPSTTEAETKARSEAFAQAFIYKKDITTAFTYIAKDYINHNPSVKNGFDAAWNALSPFWGSSNITPLRTAFVAPQSWVNYNAAGFGEVVDRFRWEGGCIVEHWDQNEKFPSIC